MRTGKQDPNDPCHAKCPKRTGGCHAVCPEGIAYEKVREANRIEKRARLEKDRDVTDFKVNAIRASKKKADMGWRKGCGYDGK